MKIVFVVDGNHKIGMGHVYRSLNLAKKLSNQLSKKKDVNKSDAILIARFFSETRLIEEK